MVLIVRAMSAYILTVLVRYLSKILSGLTISKFRYHLGKKKKITSTYILTQEKQKEYYTYVVGKGKWEKPSNTLGHINM